MLPSPTTATRCCFRRRCPSTTAAAVAGVFPDLIEHYKKSHQKSEKWVKEVYETRYECQLFDIKTYCRQTLIGGNYGLLDTTTFVPNPDYYSTIVIPPDAKAESEKLPNSASSSFVCSYPAPSQSASQAALRRLVEAHNEQMKDMHSQLADKNIELRLPAPLDPNDFLDDASDEGDEGDEGDAHEDAADPGDE
ncbi:heparanase-like protein 1 [Tanacetum coccineum]